MSDGSTAHMPLLLSSRYQNLTVRLDVCEFRVEHWPLTIVLPLFMTQPQPAHSLGLWVFGSSICFWYACVCVCVYVCICVNIYIHTYRYLLWANYLHTIQVKSVQAIRQLPHHLVHIYIYTYVLFLCIVRSSISDFK